MFLQCLQGITEGINQGNEKIKTLKNQIEAENNKTESATENIEEETTTENVTEETTTVQTDNVDMEKVTEQQTAVQKQSKQSKEDKIHKLTLALRNLSNKSRSLKDAIRKGDNYFSN